MDKYGMVDSVNEIDKGGGAASLAPTSEVAQPPNKGLKPLSATSLAPNGEGLNNPVQPQVSVPNAPDVAATKMSPAMERLRKAMLSGAQDAIKQSAKGGVFNTPTNVGGVPEPKPSMPVGAEPQSPAVKSLSQMPPPPAPAPNVVTNAKGVKGWNRGDVFVEFPQDIDANDSEAVAKRMELDEQIISWMDEDEED